MNNPVKLSSWQVILLLVNGRLIIELIYQPSLVVPPANQDIWVVELLALIYLFIIGGPMLFLANRFKTMTPPEYSEIIMGKFVGKALGLVFVAVLLVNSQMNLNLVIDFLESAMLPETPTYVTALFMLIPCTYLIYKGLESMGRLMELLVPTFLAIIILYTAVSIKDMKFTTFLPVLADSEISQFGLGAWKIASRFSELIVLGMLAPHIREKNTIRTFAYAAVITTFLMLLVTISVQARLGIALPKEDIFPYYSFVRQISAYDVIERVEAFNVFVWLMGLFLKYSLYLLLALIGLAQVLQLRSHRVLILPITTVLCIIALESPLNRYATGITFASQALPIIGFTGMFVVPAILLIVYFLRRLDKQHKTGGLETKLS